MRVVNFKPCSRILIHYDPLLGNCYKEIISYIVIAKLNISALLRSILLLQQFSTSFAR